MIIRNLDDSADWQFGNGLQSYARDERAVEINIATRLRSWVGDCFFALQDGIDWRSRLDVGQGPALKDEIKAAILQSYGVVSVDMITVEQNAARDILVRYKVNTIYGQIFTGLVSV